MTHRVVLFKWLLQDEKEVLNIVEYPFKTVEEAIKFLDEEVEETEYDVAKILFGDELCHVRQRRHHHHDQNFS